MTQILTVNTKSSDPQAFQFQFLVIPRQSIVVKVFSYPLTVEDMKTK